MNLKRRQTVNISCQKKYTFTTETITERWNVTFFVMIETNRAQKVVVRECFASFEIF